MNVSLTPELEQFIQMEIKDGLYGDASEVVRAALLRLKEEHKPRLPELPDTLEELEAQLRESDERLDRGEGIDGKESARRLRAMIKQFTTNA